MGDAQWMIYGANGYTGSLIAREARRQGLAPLLAGRDETEVSALAGELGLDHRTFGLHSADTQELLADVRVLVNAAGPFSATAEPLMAACLASGTHYCDITGEIGVFEHAHSLDRRAREAGIVLCPGVGFDVIPTDCLAAHLKDALPGARYLALGFESRSRLSPGTAKTTVEGLAQGGKIRRDGRIVTTPLADKVRSIDFGTGPKTAMTIPWGDVATAYYTTGIPNIEVYVPTPPKAIARLQRLNWLRPLLGSSPVQRALKALVERRVSGPDANEREDSPTAVWGEARADDDSACVARVRTANGYTVTQHGAVLAARHLLESHHDRGYQTPALLMGKDLVSRLPGSSPISIDRGE